MMVFFSAPIFDPAGAVVLFAERGQSSILGYQRRLSRTATLDGGSYIYDGGFSHADRTLKFTISTISESQLDILLHLCRDYTVINCAIADEFFLAVLEEVSVTSEVKIKLLVQSKLSL